MQSISTSPQRSRSSECERVETDEGYTLIELLIAIILMGTVVLSIMGGMWAVVRASRQSDERAKVQAVLGSAADRVSVMIHNNCPEEDGVYELFASKAAASVGWHESAVRIVDYKYWDGATWVDDCNLTAGLTVKRTLQKLTIEATAPGTGFSSQLVIIKSDIRPKEVLSATP